VVIFYILYVFSFTGNTVMPHDVNEMNIVKDTVNDAPVHQPSIAKVTCLDSFGDEPAFHRVENTCIKSEPFRMAVHSIPDIVSERTPGNERR
jgi:hypothetical protein